MACAFIRKIAVHAKSSRCADTDDVASLCDVYAGSACGIGLHGMVDDAFAALLDYVMAEIQRAPFDRELAAICRQADRDFNACQRAEQTSFCPH